MAHGCSVFGGPQTRINERTQVKAKTGLDRNRGRRLPELPDQHGFLRQIQEVDEEPHAVLRLLCREAVDAAKEPQGIADGELVVQGQILRRTTEMNFHLEVWNMHDLGLGAFSNC